MWAPSWTFHYALSWSRPGTSRPTYLGPKSTSPHGSRPLCLLLPYRRGPSHSSLRPLASFSTAYEKSFTGHVSTPDGKLPPACFGRGHTHGKESSPSLVHTCPGPFVPTDLLMRINKRYKAVAARGPDGFSARDLQWMPQCFIDELVTQLNNWEATSEWLQPLLTGFVHPLPKRDNSTQVGDFRPVIAYSTIYRSWSSLRARGFLVFLSSLVDEHQFGFLPGCEATEIWFLLQGLLETAHQTGECYNGFVTDLVKAFESLPRTPVRLLCEWIGLPKPVLDLWHQFLGSMDRRFRIGNRVGPSLSSNTGYPEGCALSCVAMAVVDLSFHLYMKVYSPEVTPLSFVDNLELLDNSMATLSTSILSLQAWADMWRLDLDEKKSYTWIPGARLLKVELNYNFLAGKFATPLRIWGRRSTMVAAKRSRSNKSVWTPWNHIGICSLAPLLLTTVGWHHRTGTILAS